MGKRYLIRITIIVWLSFVFFLLAGATKVFADDGLDFLEFRGPWGHSCFFVQVADTPSKKNRGLMYVNHMPENQGMLFIYQEPRETSFWMKNTKIPLDLIFLNSTGQVVHIHHNAEPLNEAIIRGGENIQYVAEINGGLAEEIGISIGSFAHHKAFSDKQIQHCRFEH